MLNGPISPLMSPSGKLQFQVVAAVTASHIGRASILVSQTKRASDKESGTGTRGEYTCKEKRIHNNRFVLL